MTEVSTPPNPSAVPASTDALSSILITGGAGFIGSHLGESLLRNTPNATLTIVDDLSTGRSSNLDLLRAIDDSRVTFINSSITDALPQLQNQSFDAIFHLAAAVGVRLILDEPVRTIETNVLETARLLEYAHQRSTPILIASSSEVYGKSTAVPFNEAQDVVYGSTVYTRWSYACTKAIDEYLALAHHRAFSLPVVIARFFNTVGPRQVGEYGMVLPRFVEAAIRNEPLTVYGDGSQQRCFCDVRDVVPALVQMITTPRCFGEVFNVGSDEIITIRRLAEVVVETLGSESAIEFMPYENAYTAGFEDLAVRQPDLSRLRAAVGFSPEIPLTQTILDIAAELRKNRTPAADREK